MYYYFIQRVYILIYWTFLIKTNQSLLLPCLITESYEYFISNPSLLQFILSIYSLKHLSLMRGRYVRIEVHTRSDVTYQHTPPGMTCIAIICCAPSDTSLHVDLVQFAWSRYTLNMTLQQQKLSLNSRSCLHSFLVAHFT